VSERQLTLVHEGYTSMYVSAADLLSAIKEHLHVGVLHEALLTGNCMHLSLPKLTLFI
jgi:hypothetical protein